MIEPNFDKLLEEHDREMERLAQQSCEEVYEQEHNPGEDEDEI